MYHPILPAYSTLCSLYYDAVKAYAGAAETDFYASFIQRHPGRALEAMSGSGRLAIPLLQRGYVVDGVDNSSAMLTRCQERLMALGLTMQQYNQSLEELALPHCYSVITIAVGSFQLITQRDTALLTLQKLYEHLLPGGVLLIDFFIPDLEAEPTSHQVQLDQTRSLQLTKRHFFDAAAQIAETFCTYQLLINGIPQQQEQEIITVTWYSEDELTALVKQAGFTDITVHNPTFKRTGPSHVMEARRTEKA